MGNTNNLTTPTQISFFKDQKVIMIAAGGYHSLAVCSDQSVYGWGEGTFGQLGNGEFFD
jgi:alpha-tubulin suppressor-like RCC1 family protein